MSAIPPPLPPAAMPPSRRGTRAPLGPAMPPVDLALLADLPSLELKARYLVEGALSGRHRSPLKGSSVEFAEYRSYQMGDDPRRVDWRLFARTDRLHLKQFEEETQLHVYLVLDTSLSMNFRSRAEGMSKLAHARLALAAIARLALRQGDAFGLALVGDELRDFLRARASAKHWGALVGRLDVVEPGGRTWLGKCLEDLAELVPRRSMIVIASDFYEEPDRIEAALRRLRHDHHDVIGLHVLDPVEIDFDIGQAGIFVDVEDGARLTLDGPAARRGYLERFGKFCADLDEMFRRAGGELVHCRTDASPVATLSGYLARRAQRS